MQKRYWQFYKSGLSILLMGIFLWACSGNQSAKQKEETPEPKTEEDLAWEKAEGDDIKEMALPLNEQIDVLTNTIEEYQQQAFASEQTKLNSSQSLIEEIEQSMTTYDRQLLDSIKQSLAAMLNGLYTDESMTNLDLMTAYDQNTAGVIEGLKRFREQNKEFNKHARAIAFYDDIMRADASDQGIRTNYNQLVHDYNKLLKTKTDELSKLGENYQGLNPYLFFYGTDPVVEDE